MGLLRTVRDTSGAGARHIVEPGWFIGEHRNGPRAFVLANNEIKRSRDIFLKKY